MASSCPCHCSILFTLVILLHHCAASNDNVHHMDEQKIEEVHHAVSQLLQQKIGKKLKEAENEVKHAVDQALDKHISHAHHILKHKDADVIIMDPNLIKLVKTAVKEGRREHRHHNHKAFHGSQSHGPVGYPHPAANQGYPTSPGFPGNPSSQSYPANPSYPSSRGYPSSPGYPASPGYPTSPGYPASPGYPVSSGYPQNPGYAAGPGVPTSQGYPNSPGQYPQYAQTPGAAGQSQQPPPSIMGGGCPQSCNQNCYSFCPKKCCGGDKRMKVTHHKNTKKMNTKEKTTRNRVKGKRASKGRETK